MAIERTRQKLEQEYLKKAQRGKRMRRTPAQLAILQTEFDRQPIWSYTDKVRIGAIVGMTFHQVCKWNFD